MKVKINGAIGAREHSLSFSLSGENVILRTMSTDEECQDRISISIGANEARFLARILADLADKADARKGG